VPEAEWAYQRALDLNRELGEVQFNLGCLRLGQNKLEAAKGDLTACTLASPNAPQAFLKLGSAQLRSREPSAAEKSFGEALRLNPTSPEALNGLGLARLQRGHVADAAQCFESALKQRPDYPPAVLNLAIGAHQYSRDRQLALRRYREDQLYPFKLDVGLRSIIQNIEYGLGTGFSGMYFLTPWSVWFLATPPIIDWRNRDQVSAVGILLPTFMTTNNLGDALNQDFPQPGKRYFPLFKDKPLDCTQRITGSGQPHTLQPREGIPSPAPRGTIPCSNAPVDESAGEREGMVTGMGTLDGFQIAHHPLHQIFQLGDKGGGYYIHVAHLLHWISLDA
jgi:hypothetical protein